MPRASAVPPSHPTDRLIGQASPMQALRAYIRHLVGFDRVGSPLVPTVLLHGETGTGKGLVAKIIHDSGPRAHGPFIDVNCAAIPDTMLEAELFGYEAGAFTDAKRPKPGLFEAAAEGTLFLDEIEALPLLLQSKLLKAVEEKRIRRLGAVAERAVDVKLIAATQVDLQARVAEGRFRLDLYHRLAVVLLELPPLRERGADILELARQFLERYATGHRLRPKRLSAEAEAWLLRRPWPGNVRELSHLMERATLLHPEPILDAATLEGLCLPSPEGRGGEGAVPVLGNEAALDEAARIREALVRTAGNVVRAAQLLGLGRDALRYRMRRYGIVPPTLEDLRQPPARLPTLEAEPSSPSPAQAGEASPVAAGAPGAWLPAEGRAQASSWEQKPVAALAIDLTWPEGAAPETPPYEPWTVAAHWEQTIVEKIQGFGGVVLQRSPSLLLVAFGIPQTLEQQAQRAVHAALALRHLIAESTLPDNGGPRLSVRLALHWGAVITDVHSHDPGAQLLSVGETLALPVRLLGHAGPGEILASGELGSLIEGWCALRAREVSLGYERLRAHTVEGLLPKPARLEAQGRRLSRFVGRGRELATLEELWDRTRDGRGQVVGMVGEPGIGKSRLVNEFIRVHRPDDGRLLIGHAASYTQATPYRPVLDLLKAYFRIEDRAAGHSIREHITRRLSGLDTALESSAPALLTLLDVPVEDPSWLALEPSQRRQRTLDAVTHLLLRESQVAPLLVVCEDVHWSDSETQAVLVRLVDALAAARLCVLVTYRPEYQHPWGGKACYTQLRLDQLSPTSAGELLRDFVGEHAGLQPLTRFLLDRTQGNPFFLEECIQTLVETRVLAGERGAYALARALPQVQVPASVHAVLGARIDRLPGEAKRLLQTAAVIGMELPLPLLQAIAQVSEDALHRSLAHLQAAEFLCETHLFPSRVYTFKHALTHEVAYGSLLPERRRILHARIIEALEGLIGDRVVEQVERLAYHALRGEMWDKALIYCRQAGDKALARSAHHEAVEYFEQALSALPHLPETRDTRKQAIDLWLALRSALRPLGEFGRILTCLRQAEALATTLNDPRRLGQVSLLLSAHFRIMGAYDQAIATGQRALALAMAHADDVLQALANERLGYAYEAQGDYRRAIDCFNQTAASLDGPRRYERFGQVFLPAVGSRAYLAGCHAELGMFAEGSDVGDEGLRIAEAVAHPTSLMYAYYGIGLLALRQGDLPRALPLLERALAICQEVGLPAYFPRMAAALGAAYTLSGRMGDVVPLLTQAMEQTTVPGLVVLQALCGLSLGEAHILAGHLKEAHAFAEGALSLTCRRQERGHQAYALRLLGEIAARREPPKCEAAEAHYRQALTLAKGLGMRPLAAHCHCGLGKLYVQLGRRDDARAELSSAIELYRAMAMAFWLPQTEAALAQVMS